MPPQYGVIELIIFRPGAKFVKIYVSFFDMHLVTLRWPPYQIISVQVLIFSSSRISGNIFVCSSAHAKNQDQLYIFHICLFLSASRFFAFWFAFFSLGWTTWCFGWHISFLGGHTWCHLHLGWCIWRMR